MTGALHQLIIKLQEYLDQKRNCPHNIIDNSFIILAYSCERPAQALM